MHSRRQLAEVIDSLIVEGDNIVVEHTTVDDYKKLNDKCDTIISKIKTRKNKKVISKTGE